ncbi:ABC transporter permease [Bacillus cytotoxicus]|uniref:ABC transporter permease n=1 Tax=Bacillus cytotoxicus TaxID=580165 RepID=UPI000863F48E|nr:ABC transporter permease [Bacillus cytotoxicus]AWC27345.1 ABC transporter permease [Bacillus cytotoxicus]AWC41281.1 ABC transporter permease [Bacillus cytotoxicus]AWC49212.1 ABC transporter permease [Bacillus cytotoxicus]AWC51411.1 ABC transporter permease [Bacillus cytotoxicus]AWC55540.1 ABC transporter permease [Bacillus cytotoxicus]
MIRIEYDRLLAIFYSVGVLLVLKFPNDNELVGEKLFHSYGLPVDTYIYMNYKISNVWVTSCVLQGLSFLLFMKWMEKNHSNWLKRFHKMKSGCIGVIMCILPFTFNQLIQTLDKTWYYAGKTGLEAIEYKKEDSECKIEKRGEKREKNCVVTLKNYRNYAQALQLVLHQDTEQNIEGYHVPTPIYLQRHETKQFKFQISVSLDENVVGNTIPNIELKLLHDKKTAHN